VFHPPRPPPRWQHRDDQQVHHELPCPLRRPNWQGMGGHPCGPNRHRSKRLHKICHFYSRLRTERQDIIDSKEYNIINHLFQLAMLAEKELQVTNRRK
jgi:hypothetical protein